MEKILSVPTTRLDYQTNISYKHDDSKALSAITYDALDRPVFATTPGSDMGGKGKSMNFWQIRPTVSRNTQSRMMEPWHKKIIT